MKRNAAPMRRWILLGMPLVAAGQAIGHMGGGVLALLLMAGAAKSPFAYPYPRKSRMPFTRLLFAWAGGVFVLSVFSRLFPHPLALPGSSAGGVLAVSLCLNLNLRKRYALPLSILLLIACM